MCKGAKATLVVNVASNWAVTASSYKALVQMYKDLKDDGLQILAYPCNQFAAQEPGTPEDIKKVAASYGAEFPIM